MRAKEITVVCGLAMDGDEFHNYPIEEEYAHRRLFIRQIVANRLGHTGFNVVDAIGPWEGVDEPTVIITSLLFGVYHAQAAELARDLARDLRIMLGQKAVLWYVKDAHGEMETE